MPVVFSLSLSNQPEQTNFSLQLSLFLFAKISSLLKSSGITLLNKWRISTITKIVVSLNKRGFCISSSNKHGQLPFLASEDDDYSKEEIYFKYSSLEVLQSRYKIRGTPTIGE